MDYLSQRRNGVLQSLMKDADGILINSSANVNYLSHCNLHCGSLVVLPKQVTLVSDQRYEVELAQRCPKLNAFIRPHTQTPIEAIAEVLNKSGAKKIALEAEHTSIGQQAELKKLCPKITFTTTSMIVETLRQVKDPSELEQIRKAIEIAERAYGMFRPMIRENDTEKELADALECFIRRAGGRASSFTPIVAVGERGALPHGSSSERKLVEGSKLLIDWGADNNYKSDMTRTIRSPFTPAPSRSNKSERISFSFPEVYELVLAAHEAAAGMLRAGVTGHDVDAAARAVFRTGKLRGHDGMNVADHFTHGVGHGIGLDVHELPRLRPNSKDELEAGMVVTIEPALYFREWGGVRIEDMYLIQKDSAIRMTTLPREF